MHTTEWDELAEYMRTFGNIRLIERDEWKPLFERYRSGDQEAKDELTYRNMRLVLSVAKRMIGRGLPLLDLMQEGAVGLGTAIDRFDPERGYAFSTYARHWVRQAITHAIETQGLRRAYRLPRYIEAQVNLVAATLKKLNSDLECKPTNLDVYQAIKLLTTKAAKSITLKEVARARLILAQTDISFENPLSESEKGGRTIGDTLPDHQVGIEEAVEARRILPKYHEAIERLDLVVGKLPPREAMIIRLRCGLGEFDPMSLEEVASRYDLTRERVRQIQVTAFKRLHDAGFEFDADEIARLLETRDQLQQIAGV